MTEKYLPILYITLGFIAVRWLLMRYIRSGLDRLMDRTQSTLDDALVGSLMKFIKLILWVLFGLLLAQSLGVNMGMAYAGAGVIALSASAAISAACKDVLGNLVAGIQMAVSPPFSLKEEVQIGKYEGVVKGVTLLYTTLKDSGDKRIFSLPNSVVISSVIWRSE